MVHGPQGLDGGGEGFVDFGGSGDVDGDGEDSEGGEVVGEGCDGGEGGAESSFEVPDAEAGGAVVEEGAGAGEAQGAGAAGYWGGGSAWGDLSD